MFFFAKTVNELLFIQKTSIIDTWHGSRYRSSRLKVLCKNSGPTNFRKFTGKKPVIESLKGEILGIGVFL